MTDEKVAQTGKWAKRFVLATVLQTTLAVVLTAYLVYEGAFGFPAASRIVAGGGAGTWLTVGYFAFVIFGPIAMALSAGLFRQVESHMGRISGKWHDRLLWIALLTYNVGIVAGTWLMMHAGYRGGAAAMSVSSGGLGWSGDKAALVHSQIMAVYPPYIAAFLGVALFGAFLGIVGLLLVWARPAKAPEKGVPAAA